MNFNPQEISQTERYKLCTGSILPRPIAWVSSMDEAGRLNVAPYSFFTVASTNPLILLFCPQLPAPHQPKDTLRNVQTVGEFVINLTNEETGAAMSRSAASLPYGESEFAYAGLTPAPSEVVRVPRVAEAPIAFECRLHHVVMLGRDEKGGGAVVFGEVQNIFVRDALYDAERHYILQEVFKPIGRLAGNGYVRVTDTFELKRGE